MFAASHTSFRPMPVQSGKRRLSVHLPEHVLVRLPVGLNPQLARDSIGILMARRSASQERQRVALAGQDRDSPLRDLPATVNASLHSGFGVPSCRISQLPPPAGSRPAGPERGSAARRFHSTEVSDERVWEVADGVGSDRLGAWSRRRLSRRYFSRTPPPSP